MSGQRKFLQKYVCRECGIVETTAMYLWENQVRLYDDELSERGWWRLRDCIGCKGEQMHHTFYLTPDGCMRVFVLEGMDEG